MSKPLRATIFDNINGSLNLLSLLAFSCTRNVNIQFFKIYLITINFYISIKYIIFYYNFYIIKIEIHI